MGYQSWLTTPPPYATWNISHGILPFGFVLSYNKSTDPETANRERLHSKRELSGQLQWSTFPDNSTFTTYTDRTRSIAPLTIIYP